MDLNDLYKRDEKYLIRVPNYSRPLLIKNGDGCLLTDLDDNSYIDFSSGWNVSNLGWSNKALLEILRTSVAPTYIPPWFGNTQKIEFAESLSRYFNGRYKLLYGVSGSDAAEFALKAAIKQTKRNCFIAFNRSFHGSTIELLKTGDFPNANKNFLLDTASFRKLQMPDANRIKDKDAYLSQSIHIIEKQPYAAGLIFEPICTNSGVLHGDSEFYSAICAAVKKFDGLIIVDEVGTGFGRTGKMFAFEHFDIDPDIIILGKAITSGTYPLSGILIKNELSHNCSGLGFYSTYGGSPLGCEIANKNFQLLSSQKSVEHVKMLYDVAINFIKREYCSLPNVYDIRGKGMSIGVELVDSDKNPLTNDIMEYIKSCCLSNGLIINFSSYTSTFIIMPPLIIDEENLIKGLKILKSAIKKYFDER